MSKKLGRIFFLLALGFVAALSWSHYSKQEINPDIIWPVIKKEHKPGVYWWWMGSAVDRENLTYNLQSLHDAGIGGVTIVPIYGVRGYENNYIDYLTREWMDMLAHTVKEAKKFDMWIDMSTGTGWPFGGSHITSRYAASMIEFKVSEVFPGRTVIENVDKVGLQALIARSEDGRILDLLPYLNDKYELSWTAPPGEWKIISVWQKATGQKVKRAAPGNLGYVVDPFSETALNYYLIRYNKAFTGYEELLPRAQYHDSYEYYKANWTSDLFDRFESLRGYDLKKYLSELFGHGNEDDVVRVRADYRYTLSDLHLSYIQHWHNWAHEKGCITREQAHGAPSNLLDLYATADIPETETFGSTTFDIPGLRRDLNNVAKDAPNPLILQFASSAAHVSGRNLVAAEACTWLREHYKVALSQIKPEIDQLFLSGINHVFYHGNAYTPAGVAWPGWLFYASAHFEPENAIWRDFPALNKYVTKCQSILQTGLPANDILLYWPIHDLWHQEADLLIQLSVHNTDWFTSAEFGKIAQQLKLKGYSFDYISDRQLQNIHSVDGKIYSGTTKYRTIIVPACDYMPLDTWILLLQLAREGASIIFQRHLPADVPGRFNLGLRREKFRIASQELDFSELDKLNIKVAKIAQGEIVVGKDISVMLKRIDIIPENMVDSGLNFIRRKYSQGYYYFIANLSRTEVNTWIPMTVTFQSAIILDPLNAQSGMAAVREKNGKNEIYLQLQPGESLILKTFTAKKITDQPWQYYHKGDTSYSITGEWKVDFIQGGPTLPNSVVTETLDTWTKIGDKEAKRFAGTARYSIDFYLPSAAADDWILQLGRVCESARVKINGEGVGIFWSVPFTSSVGQYLQSGKNTLEVEVTNLSANRIADLDRRKVEWKKFHDINFVNIHYQKFDASDWPLMDSGLLGPVTLVPVKLMDFIY